MVPGATQPFLGGGGFGVGSRAVGGGAVGGGAVGSSPVGGGLRGGRLPQARARFYPPLACLVSWRGLAQPVSRTVVSTCKSEKLMRRESHNGQG